MNSNKEREKKVVDMYVDIQSTQLDPNLFSETAEKEIEKKDVDIQSTTLDPDLFSITAKKKAVLCNEKTERGKTLNSPSQIRRFYDELVMWNEKVSLHPEKYKEVAPYIQMLCAKVAYSKGRELVSANFENMFVGIIKQINGPETLKRAKLFFEAFLGFRKGLEKK